ncbi:hypothetical protein CNQ40_12060 [Enterococcus faecalis]|nr:hypothetical protein CNQ40_12060 [Enterococcus faecalis]
MYFCLFLAFFYRTLTDVVNFFGTIFGAITFYLTLVKVRLPLISKMFPFFKLYDFNSSAFFLSLRAGSKLSCSNLLDSLSCSSTYFENEALSSPGRVISYAPGSKSSPITTVPERVSLSPFLSLAIEPCSLVKESIVLFCCLTTFSKESIVFACFSESEFEHPTKLRLNTNNAPNKTFFIIIPPNIYQFILS